MRRNVGRLEPIGPASCVGPPRDPIGNDSGKETTMARVALVTGGTRGIGAAISKALKEAGHTVAANYGGNDEAAAKFKAETGIPVYKFDVSDAAACEAGIKAVASELGPVD